MGEWNPLPTWTIGVALECSWGIPNAKRYGLLWRKYTRQTMWVLFRNIISRTHCNNCFLCLILSEILGFPRIHLFKKHVMAWNKWLQKRGWIPSQTAKNKSPAKNRPKIAVQKNHQGKKNKRRCYHHTISPQPNPPKRWSSNRHVSKVSLPSRGPTSRKPCSVKPPSKSLQRRYTTPTSALSKKRDTSRQYLWFAGWIQVDL